VLEPGNGPFNLPTSLVSAQRAAVLSLVLFLTMVTVRRNQHHASFGKIVVELIVLL
jgi:hypothetical protein